MVGDDELSKKQVQAGKKAAKTRRERHRHRRQVQAGHKASRTRYASELNYIEALSESENVAKDRIFHHEGLPDLMAITDGGKLIFCEIKPEKGSEERKMLNESQSRAIRMLLKQSFVEKVLLVRYVKDKGLFFYDKAIRLTDKNIGRYSSK